MKKILITMLIFILFIQAFSLCVSAAETDSSVITFAVTESDDGEIIATAKLRENSGVLSMKLTLSYDKEVLTFIGYEKGNALASLDLVATNAQTEAGYSITPFIFLYEGEENDTSTGDLLTLRFRLKDSIPNGTYPISLTYKRNTDVTVLSDSKLETKNLLVDKVNVEVKDNQIDSLTIIEDTSEEEKTNILPIAITASVIIVGIAALVIINFRIRAKKKNKWVKI